MAPTKGTEDPRALAFALARARDRARNPRPSTSRKPTRCPQSLRCGATRFKPKWLSGGDGGGGGGCGRGGGSGGGGDGLVIMTFFK